MLHESRTNASLTSVSPNPIEDKRASEGWHVPGRDGDGVSLDAIAALRAEPPGRVLSVYVNADAREGAASTPAWHIKLKDQLNQLLDGDVDHDSATSLARLGQWLLERLKAELDPGMLRRSLAIFGTETPRRLEVLVLPQPIGPAAGRRPDVPGSRDDLGGRQSRDRQLRLTAATSAGRLRP